MHCWGPLVYSNNGLSLKEHFFCLFFTLSVLAFPLLHHATFHWQTKFQHKTQIHFSLTPLCFVLLLPPLFLTVLCTSFCCSLCGATFYATLSLTLSHSLDLTLPMSSSFHHYSHGLHFQFRSLFPTKKLSLYLSHYLTLTISIPQNSLVLSPLDPYLTLSLSQYPVPPQSTLQWT